MSTVLLPTRAFEVRDGGPFAIRAWDFQKNAEDFVRVTVDGIGGRVLLFENLQRIRDFYGHLMGRGHVGNRAWGVHAVRNMSSYKPEHRDPQPGDVWSRDYYLRLEESPRQRERLVTARS